MFQQASLEKICICSQFIIPRFINSANYVPIGPDGTSRCLTSLHVSRDSNSHCMVKHRWLIPSTEFLRKDHGKWQLAPPAWSAGSPGEPPRFGITRSGDNCPIFPYAQQPPQSQKGGQKLTLSLPALPSKSKFDQTLSHNQDIRMFTQKLYCHMTIRNSL